MKVEPVDGYFGENVIVFEGLHRGGFIARGFEITAPDLENADPVHHNALESDLIALLTVLKAGQRMQVQWDVGGNYRSALLRTASRLLAPDGMIVFSNNYQKFRLDPSLREVLEVEDITRSTIPEDFARNPRIHACFVLRPRTFAALAGAEPRIDTGVPGRR